MRDRGDPQIDERLISDTLSEFIDRVDTGRDLWPGIRDRLSQRRRAGVPVLVKLVAAAAVVALIVMLAIARPWSLFEDAMSPFAAVAHAYEGLYELETVRYRVDGTNGSGQEFVELYQVDMVNRIEYRVEQTVLGSQEFVRINGNHYVRRSPEGVESFTSRDWDSASSDSATAGWSLFPDPIRHPKEGYPWAPLGKLGGIPWSRETTEESFDKVELVGNAEVDGQPVIHYRASRRSEHEDRGDRPLMVRNMYGKRMQAVHSGLGTYLVTIDTVDFWITPDGGMLMKADWTHSEQGPALPEDFRVRDWCQGLGEFSRPEYGFREFDEQEKVPGVVFGSPIMSRNTHDLGVVICWNEDKTEGRVPWGRNLLEIYGDFWVRWVYTFTAFNEALDLPDDLPE